MGRAMAERWYKLQRAATDRSLQASDWTGSFTSFTKAFRLFLQSAILALGAYLVLQGQVTPGAMIASSILLGRALAPIDQSIGQWYLVQRARAGWRDLQELLKEVPPREQPTQLPPPEARLTVEGITLYVSGGDAPVLRNVSFEVEPGEALGVIGRSGSGKTTLARILVGLV